MSAETKTLKQQVEDLQALVLTLQNKQESVTTFDAMEQIDKVGKVDTDKILLVEKHDHKNISLWTKLGKRVGPMHPHNAKATLIRFKKVNGVDLSVMQPTAEQIEAYKLTDEYKLEASLLAKSREAKERSRKGNSMEKYASEIAKQLGKSVDELTSIKNPSEVTTKKGV